MPEQSSRYDNDKQQLFTGYPLVDVCRKKWLKKINSTSMSTILAEQEALPTLLMLEQMLQRLVDLPLSDTIPLEDAEFFFTQVFAAVCQKIIRSRFFKNHQVLHAADHILELTLLLLPKHIDIIDSMSPFAEIMTIVLQGEEFYFKNNSQLHYKQHPYLYYEMQPCSFGLSVKLGDLVDVLRYTPSNDKLEWAQGKVVGCDQKFLEIEYLLNQYHTCITVQRTSYQIAEYLSHSKAKYEWRQNIKVGDLVDAEDSFGGWYNSTVIAIYGEKEFRRVKLTFKVYHPNGTKQDSNGKFFGYIDYPQTFNISDPRLQPFCSIAKEFSYETTRSSFDFIDDVNDYEIQTVNRETVYALPRKKHLCAFFFHTLNAFGKLGGFSKILDVLEQEKARVILLVHYVKGLSGVAPYLHKKILTDTIQRLKRIIQRHIYSQDEEIAKQFTRQRSQMLFSGLRTLQRRLVSLERAYEYENSLKVKLVDRCINSVSLKRKLQGLSQIKEIVKSLNYGSSRNAGIIAWIKAEQIFDKIYFLNSHVQLIKKSQSFFRYCINEGILQLQDLQRLLKMAQKGDYETRISLYTLFQEVSHIYKRVQVQYLIDKILESPPDVILNEDIDLLHQLSKLSNYFPIKKVMPFFESIILKKEESQVSIHAAKKYADIVARNYDLRAFRKEIICNLIDKIPTHSFSKIASILKQIFEGIGIGEIGKQDLTEILSSYDLDSMMLHLIQSAQEEQAKKENLSECLKFLLVVYQMSSKCKTNLVTLQLIWEQVKHDRKMSWQFIKWLQEVVKCEQNICKKNDEQFDSLFKLIFQYTFLTEMSLAEFEVFRNLLIEVNKSLFYLTATMINIVSEREVSKDYKRKVSLNELKLIPCLLRVALGTVNTVVSEKALQLYAMLVNIGQNTIQQISDWFNTYYNLLSQLCKKEEDVKLSASEALQAKNVLKLIQIIIDDSQKYCPEEIPSLLGKKKNNMIKLVLYNEVPYYTSIIKKVQLWVSSNTTLGQLRRALMKEVDLNWQEIKISGKKEFPDSMNSRTLKELKISSSEVYTISRRYQSYRNEAKLIIQGQFNPKALRVFQTIFNDYSTNGKMNQAQCRSFTTKCLGAVSYSIIDDRIDSIFRDYDTDKDHLLTFENFSNFYFQNSIERPDVVWSNLRNFGVHNDLRLKDQPLEPIDYSYLPRKIMAANPETYDILFRLLKSEEIAEKAFDLLQRLPVSHKVQREILSANEDSLNLDRILHPSDTFQMFYRLHIIEYLTTSNESNSEEEKEWVLRFISEKGYEKLTEILFGFIGSICVCQTRITKEIVELLIDLLQPFLMSCFATHQGLSSWALQTDDSDIDDKLEYVMTGKFPSPTKKLTVPQRDVVYQFTTYSKLQICQQLLHLIKQIWVQENSSYRKSDLLNKCLNLLSFLLIGEDPTCLVDCLSFFIDKSASTKELKQLYCLIMCYCSYSKEHQQLFVKKLFDCLAMSNVISQHFGILAILVSKYGLTEVNDQQTMHILMSNIFGSTNELTIEGCAQLLCNFKLDTITEQTFDNLWQSCFFQEHKCVKDNTKQAIYELMLKICSSNPQLAKVALVKLQATLKECFSQMRITSCAQINVRSSTTFVGLKNLGSICYINSMMQQLFSNKTFRYLIARIDDGKAEELVEHNKRMVDDNILHQLQRIFGYLEYSTRMDFVPADFCLAYKPFGAPVNLVIQQDVQEFISMLFDQLGNRIKDTPFKEIVDAFYSGSVANLFNCHECAQTKKVIETFYSITLQVKNSKTLQQSFNRFILGELINDYKCDFCGKKADVSKLTRINKSPKILTIHLQRIVFNLDTFINEKITTKHTFPMSFNLYPYTIECYEKNPTVSEASFVYNLIGIICHNGNAESGHYISYIKITENKWLQFNDSLINNFDISRLEEECFGGNLSSHFIEDFEWDKSNESAKSAYILLYEREGRANLELILQSLDQKKLVLQQLNLQELVAKLDATKQVREGSSDEPKVEQTPYKSEDNEDEDETESATKPESVDNFSQRSTEKEDDSVREVDGYQVRTDKSSPQQQKTGQQHAQPSQGKEREQLQQNKHLQEQNKSNSDEPQSVKTEQAPNDESTPTKAQCQQVSAQSGSPSVFKIQLDQNVCPYIQPRIHKQILNDNKIHFFEKIIASPHFAIFFAKLLRYDNQLAEEMFPLLKKMTFGFWLKSIHLKELLNTNLLFIKKKPEYLRQLVIDNQQIVTLMLESSDQELRSKIACFTAKALSMLISTDTVSLQDDSEEGKKITIFLDNMLGLLPTTVSKCWTKFSEYFQFWRQFAKSGHKQVSYMMRREFIKHFIDYFLDKKSPLQIYAKKANQIGSSYASPNFSMLLKTVSYLISMCLQPVNQCLQPVNQCFQPVSKFSLSQDDLLLLLHFDSLQKLLSENTEGLASSLIVELCKHNLHASEKVAIVLIKSLYKTTFIYVQPYLNIIEEYCLIDDAYQDLRISWVLGKQTLCVTTYHKTIAALSSSYNYQERLYMFNSTINIEQSSSLIEYIFDNYRPAENLCMLQLKCLLRLCQRSEKIHRLVFGLAPPVLYYARMTHFYQYFIELYGEEVKKSYYHQGSLNKEELIAEVKKLYEKLKALWAEKGLANTATLAGGNKDCVLEKESEVSKDNIVGKDNVVGKDADVVDQNKAQNGDKNVEVEKSTEAQQEIEDGIQKKDSSQKENDDLDDSMQKQHSSDKQYSGQEDAKKEQNNVSEDAAAGEEEGAKELPVETEIKVHPSPSNNPQETLLQSSGSAAATPIQEQSQPKTAVEKLRGNRTKLNIKIPIKKGLNEEFEQYKSDQFSSGQDNSYSPMYTSTKYEQVYMPVKFHFVEKSSRELEGLKIVEHESEVSYLLLKPNGKTNNSFKASSMLKNIDKIFENQWLTEKTEKVHGFFVTNNSGELLRFQTNEGTSQLRPVESMFVWADRIDRVFPVDRFGEWPKWTMYPLGR